MTMFIEYDIENDQADGDQRNHVYIPKKHVTGGHAEGGGKTFWDAHFGGAKAFIFLCKSSGY